MRKIKQTSFKSNKDNRVSTILAIIFLFNFFILLKLFDLQIINGDHYDDISSNQHDIYRKIVPERGKILMEDHLDRTIYPIAINHKLALVYADPRIIDDPTDTAEKLTEILKPLWLKEFNDILDTNDSDADNDGLSESIIDDGLENFIDNKNKELRERLSKKKDPYEVLAKEVPNKELEDILALKNRGIGYVDEDFRYYPEGEILSQVSGFVGYFGDEHRGQYGIEGYFDELLRGKQGSILSEKDGHGRIIMNNDSEVVPAENGVDLILTIDRAVQFRVCMELKNAVESHDADSGMVVVMEPDTGAIIAMCSVPSFDANFYHREKDIGFFNNPIVFNQYEPGSIFKAVTIAAGLDAGKISPSTTYYDTGCINIGVDKICNSDLKSHKIQSMTNVLEESLNTGTIFVLNQVGREKFKEYIEDFGFGVSSGVELKPESVGDIDSLNSRSEIYSATASFGQGISVTPLQMVNAFSVIANGGKLMKPYIVKRMISGDGIEKETKPKEVRRVISRKTAVLLSGMLASAVENGHGGRAGVKGYYVAGKTGTAQIPKKDGSGYEEDETIGSFVGFAPVDNPKFTMLVRIDNPKDVIWAESSAAPLFGKIAKFILDYYQVKPSK